MNKYTANILTLLLSAIAICDCSNVYGQSSQDKAKVLNNLFEKSITKSHQEKIYIHTDRSLYVTGETVWMSAYCVDAALHIPVKLSKVVNIELLNSKGESLKSERIQLNNSLGNGQMFMSPEIPSGVYTLRGFTNWMKNFDPDLVFNKQITILNPSSPPINNGNPTSENNIEIDFFPEGGNLVYGLKSKVAVKTTNSQGNGVVVSGIIFDQNDSEVAKFNTSKNGDTFFLLTPKEKNSYTAVIAQGGKINKYELPKPSSSGAILSIVNLAQGEFVVGINSKNIASEKLFLVVHTRGIINTIKEIEVNDSKSFKISENDLAPGITHLTVLNSDFEPLAERLIFNYPESLKGININLSKSTFTNRDKVNISIEAKDIMEESDAAFLSLSVLETNDFNKHSNNIISSLLLTSDIKGHISDPWSLFDSANSDRKKQMDMVMLTHGWRRFSWSELTANDTLEYKYPSEIKAPLLSGKFISDEDEKMPRSVFIGLPGKSSILNSADLDVNGNFHFDVPFRVRNEEALFFVNSPTLPSNKLEIYDPFDLFFSSTKSIKSNFQLSSKKYLEGLNINIQLSQVYRDFNNINGSLKTSDEVKHHFYGEPDYTYILDDYTRFETIKDLFIEYIRSAVIRKRDKETGFYVVKENGVLPGKAMTMIDGIPIMDTEFIMNFDPLKIEKIGVVNDVYYMGAVGFQGLINFTTYEGDFDLEEIPEYLVKKSYQGIQQQRQFYSPNYTAQKEQLKRIPDYRNTLYWNPQITIQSDKKSNIDFYTSDASGSYDVVVNGITKTGKPIYKKVQFSVDKTLP